MAGEKIQLNENEHREEAEPGQTGQKSLPDVASTPVQHGGRAAPIRMPLFHN
jgi:hypothetical protein